MALVGIIAVELRPGLKLRSRPLDATPSTATPAFASVSASTAPDDKHLVETMLARPLFSDHRRPPSFAPAEPIVATRAKLPRLAGIIIDDRHRSVVFAPAGDEKPIVVFEGGSLYGFRVDRIEYGAVTVSSPGLHETLRTSFDSNAPARPPVGQVTPVPAQSQASYNGPPGLDRMPPLVTADPGLATSPTPSLLGIPGLAPPQR